jgi:RsiW-degrading membrane proteinase PrsW (M82 family)
VSVYQVAKMTFLGGALSLIAAGVWTAMVGSALWSVKGERSFAASMLTHPDVVRRRVIAVVLHGLWDADFPLVHPYVQLFVLVVVGWYLVLAILKQALAEVEQARLRAVAA